MPRHPSQTTSGMPFAKTSEEHRRQHSRTRITSGQEQLRAWQQRQLSAACKARPSANLPQARHAAIFTGMALSGLGWDCGVCVQLRQTKKRSAALDSRQRRIRRRYTFAPEHVSFSRLHSALGRNKEDA